jgi:hypothetical protein
MFNELLSFFAHSFTTAHNIQLGDDSFLFSAAHVFFRDLRSMFEGELLEQRQGFPENDFATNMSNAASMAALRVQRSLTWNADAPTTRLLQSMMPRTSTVNNPSCVVTGVSSVPANINALRVLVRSQKQAKKAPPAATAAAAAAAAAGGGGASGNCDSWCPPVGGVGGGHPILSTAASRNSRQYRNNLSVEDKLRHAANARGQYHQQHDVEVVDIDDDEVVNNEAVNDAAAAAHFHDHQWNTPHDSAEIFQREQDDLALALALSSSEEFMTDGPSPMEPTQLDMQQGEGIGRAHSFGGYELAAAAAVPFPAAAAAATVPRPAAAFAPSPATGRLGRARQLHYNNQHTQDDEEDDGLFDDVYDAFMGDADSPYSGLVHSMACDSLASGQLTQEFLTTTITAVKRRRNKKKRSLSCP